MLPERVREALADHVVVWLDVDARPPGSGSSGSQRPLARDREAFERRSPSAATIYASLADAVLPGRPRAAARALPSLRALRELPPAPRMAWAR